MYSYGSCSNVFTRVPSMYNSTFSTFESSDAYIFVDVLPVQIVFLFLVDKISLPKIWSLPFIGLVIPNSGLRFAFSTINAP
jgi:hypothetical protein